MIARAIVLNSAVGTASDGAVTLTTDYTIPTGCRFVLTLAKGQLVNVTTGEVYVADGTTTYTCMTPELAPVRYDQLVFVSRVGARCANVCLVCSVQNGTLLVTSKLPASSYAIAVS